MKPRLLDLFCGAGGAAKGYQRAGFYVVGVDIYPQPRYCGDEFFQRDALQFIEDFMGGIEYWHPDGLDAIHASPPCQAYAQLGSDDGRHLRLIEPVRELLAATGLPYVIENIPRAPLLAPSILCGSSLGLRVRRHRAFETNWPLFAPPCAHGLQRSNPHRLRHGYEAPADAIVPVYGGGQAGFSIERCREAMGISWMTTDEINEAIPPAYTELIGAQLLDHLRARASA